MTSLRLSLLALGFLPLLVGCSGDDGNDGNDGGGASGGKPPTEMVGTWSFDAVTVDGSPAALATVLGWAPGTAEAHMDVQANAAYVYEEVNASGGQLWAESGFVFIDGTEIDVNVQSNSDGPHEETRRYMFTLTGTMWTLSRVEGEQTVELTLSKQ